MAYNRKPLGIRAESGYNFAICGNERQFAFCPSSGSVIGLPSPGKIKVYSFCDEKSIKGNQLEEDLPVIQSGKTKWMLVEGVWKKADMPTNEGIPKLSTSTGWSAGEEIHAMSRDGSDLVSVIADDECTLAILLTTNFELACLSVVEKKILWRVMDLPASHKVIKVEVSPKYTVITIEIQESGCIDGWLVQVRGIANGQLCSEYRTDGLPHTFIRDRI